MKRIVGISMGVGALKRALKEKKITLVKILKVVTQLGVDHRVINYIEALS